MSGVCRVPVALISGGSSGIGLEIARLLRARGFNLHLAARDAQRLAQARDDLAASPGGTIEIHTLDVCDPAACDDCIRAVLALEGQIDWLVTSAGMAEPGLFLTQDADVFRRHMDTNYFGTLNLVRPAARAMATQGGGRIVLISSAAAFTGIVGYAAYGPSKAAVKALGESLYADLGAQGISVSVAFPQDTDTPQLAAENRVKPEVTKRITAGGGVVSPQRVARAIVEGVLAGRREITVGWLIRLLGLFHSLHAGFFLAGQRRAMRQPSSPPAQE